MFVAGGACMSIRDGASVRAYIGMVQHNSSAYLWSGLEKLSFLFVLLLLLLLLHSLVPL